MINLLPWRKQKQIQREYRYRVLVLGGIFVVIALGVSVVILGTYYFILQNEKGNLESIRKTQSTSPEVQENIETIHDLEKKLAVLSKDDRRHDFTDIFKIVTEKKTAGIHINEFVIKNNADTSILDVKGRAETRDEFVGFLEKLESEELFLSVESPISNLSKSFDIQFSITIELAPHEA